MSNFTTNNQKENSSSIPIYFSNHFSSNKDILIGKVQNLSDKSSFKVNVETKDTSIPGVKEYNLVNEKDDYLQFTGKENVQDSNYVLMKYDPKNNEIQMYPANIWINFFKSNKKIKKDEKDIKDKEKELKEQIKRNNKMMREHFNFEQEINEGDKKKQKKPKKKKGILANNEDEEASKDEPKKTLKEFEEDSHSSEIEMELGYDSFEFEDEEEQKKEDKKKKEEEKTKKNKKDEDDEEEEEEEDEDDKDINSDVSNDEDFKKMNDYFIGIGKKRERENNPGYDLEEKMENLLRRKNRMTEDELIIELKKVCKKEDIEKYFEKALDNITNSFMEDDGEKYYYLKK